jgi:hypothetical protein
MCAKQQSRKIHLETYQIEVNYPSSTFFLLLRSFKAVFQNNELINLMNLQKIISFLLNFSSKSSQFTQKSYFSQKPYSSQIQSSLDHTLLGYGSLVTLSRQKFDFQCQNA